VSIAAVSFFRLRPSDFSAPDRPLLKRRQTGKGANKGIHWFSEGCRALSELFINKMTYHATSEWLLKQAYFRVLMG